MERMNRIAITPLYDAAMHHLNRWVTDGTPPPSQPKISFVDGADGPEVVRDEHGIPAIAIDYLPLQYGSALGTGILVSLEALLPDAGIDAQKIINASAEEGGAKNQTNAGQSLDDKKTALATASPSTSQGRQMAIVLMSDGQNNMGPELKQMADLAAKHQVKIYTVGIGTTEGDVIQMQGRSMRVKLEDEALKKVSAITQGEYFKADSAQALKSVYNKLGHRLRFEKRAMSEVTAHVSILGLLLVLASVARNFVRMGKII